MAEWFVESILADRLGLTRKALEDFRKAHLKKTADWKIENRQVLVREKAVKKMLADLDVTDLADYSAAAAKNGATPNDLHELIVTKVFPNPRLVQARDLDTGEMHLVHVTKNANFRPRMVLKARPYKGQRLLKLEGRTPRFPGKW